MKESYVFAAVLEEMDDMMEITFPALELTTCAERSGDVIDTAQEALALALIDLLDAGEPVPADQPPAQITGNQRLVYVHVWLPYFRSRVREVYVKKTLTIPVWLDQLARRNGVNFSAALVDALKEKLHLPRE